MGRVVILAVVAAWAAVLVPPLLRSRAENRPNSSVTDFRNQLSSLQRTVPTRTMVSPRAMGGRPLVASQQHRNDSAMRSIGAQSAARGVSVSAAQRSIERRDLSRGFDASGGLQRRNDSGAISRNGRQLRDHRAQADPRDHHGHRQMQVHRVSQREVVRRRRANVLFLLGIATVGTAFLAATTKSSGMTYAFALAFVTLCGYCYKLVQIRNLEVSARYGDNTWFNAA
jgi:hypothetical protein